VDVAGLRFPPHRAVFLVLVPLALVRLFSRPDTRVAAFDCLLIVLAAWQVAIYSYHEGSAGFVYGGSLALEISGAYLIARAYIRDIETLHATLRFLILTVAVAAGLALFDIIGRGYVTHNFLRGLIGGPPMPHIEPRMGITRAAGPFDHPIHYGVYCSYLLAFAWYAAASARQRYFRAGILVLATYFSMSSAPMLSIGLQSMMLVWEFWTRGAAMRMHLTLAVLAGLYIGVSFVATRTPMQLLVTGMTFDPWTGLYRMLIWEHGLNNVWESPWTGLGLADWDRPAWMVASTIDNFWLVLAMRSGIPAFLILAVAIFLLGRAVVRRGTRSKDIERRRLSRGWMISLIALCLLGATVHLWNVPHAVLFFFLGLGGVLADPKRVKNRVAKPAIMRTEPALA
jgi:hypothetical protein